MKNIFVISILTILINFSCSKNKDEGVLDGLFDLRLGMSESQLNRVVDTALLKDTVFSDHLWTDKAIEGKELKILYLDRYVIDENYAIENITLTFSKDKLYEIQIEKYNPITEELLTQKHGLWDDELVKIGKDWYKRKNWSTGKPFTIVVGSALVTDSNGSFIRYVLYLRDEKINRKIDKEINAYWDKIMEKGETIKKEVR